MNVDKETVTRLNDYKDEQPYKYVKIVTIILTNFYHGILTTFRFCDHTQVKDLTDGIQIAVFYLSTTWVSGSGFHFVSDL